MPNLLVHEAMEMIIPLDTALKETGDWNSVNSVNYHLILDRDNNQDDNQSHGELYHHLHSMYNYNNENF